MARNEHQLLSPQLQAVLLDTASPSKPICSPALQVVPLVFSSLDMHCTDTHSQLPWWELEPLDFAFYCFPPMLRVFSGEEEIFSLDELIVYFLLKIRIYLHICIICKRPETAETNGTER